MKVLVVQPAFLGDVLLATSVLESLHTLGLCLHPHILVRTGNEQVFAHHPFVEKVHVWDKSNESLSSISKRVRSEHYDVVLNLQRHARSGWLTVRSGAPITIGFDKNPLSRLFTRRIPHVMDGRHEIHRNHELVTALIALLQLELPSQSAQWKSAQLVAQRFSSSTTPTLPAVYPSAEDCEAVACYQAQPYVCIAPTSVWFTKQYPIEKWIHLIDRLDCRVLLLGGSADATICEQIVQACSTSKVTSLAGKVSVLQSAALMRDAHMNYVNDSAAMHVASCVLAPTTAVFCSTVPRFGFGPLSPNSTVVETVEHLTCRPCGVHGLKECPQGHFRCAQSISVDQVLRSTTQH